MDVSYLAFGRVSNTVRICRQWGGLKTAWIAGPSGTKSSWRPITSGVTSDVIQRTVGCIFLTYPLKIWMVEQSVLPGLQITPNWEKWLINHRFFCHPEESWQAGEIGQQEPHEVHQGEVPSTAHGEEQPQVTIYAGDQRAGKHFGRKRPGDAGGHHEPAVGPLSKETSCYPGLH